MAFNRLVSFFGHEGMVTATAVTSWIVTANTNKEIIEKPFSSLFGGLFWGGIGGSIIESCTPLPARPFIAGGFLFVTGATIIGRPLGWIESPKESKNIKIKFEMKPDSNKNI